MNEDERTEQGEQTQPCEAEATDSRVREQEAEIAALRSEIAQMRTLPHVVGATPGGEPETSRQQFSQMGYTERVRLRRENPTLYQRLTE